MKKDKNKTILIILAIIIAILVIISIFLYAKLEAVDDRDDHSGYTTNQNNNVNNDNSSINNDNNISDNNNNSNYISKDEALEKALNSLNISQSNIYDLSNELDYKYGQTVYEIEFKYDGYEYEFYIDAETGNIVKSFKERD